MANLWWSRGGLKKWEEIPKHPLETIMSTGHCTQHRYFLFWKIWQKNDSVQSETYYTIVPTLLLQPCLYDLPWYQLVSLCFQDILCLWVAISKLYILLGKLLCSIERKIPGMVQRRVLLNLLQFSTISQYHSSQCHQFIVFISSPKKNHLREVCFSFENEKTANKIWHAQRSISISIKNSKFCSLNMITYS